MRGNPRQGRGIRIEPGSIPARAGEPHQKVQTQANEPVYPRACGGTKFWSCGLSSVTGLSPRVRGNPPARARCRCSRRSIPARAGEPPSPTRRQRHGPVYPRACGGTWPGRSSGLPRMGLSPRVRGNLHRVPHQRRPARSIPARAGNRQAQIFRRRSIGSIPARAGEPARRRCTAGPFAVYPRACGRTLICSAPGAVREGLSPRVRGNQGVRSRRVGAGGSIPARAGEPGVQKRMSEPPRVYPRACGGTSVIAFSRRRTEVYPRACGGTKNAPGSKRTNSGLSPRVRGNPGQRLPAQVHPGSIPARAGEPGIRPPLRRCRTVYPRACGGTISSFMLSSSANGLSPRVRGNRSGWRVRVRWCGSIPARAGEPGTPTTIAGSVSVYPRACGGTFLGVAPPATDYGLSPRVRGNRVELDAVAEPDRSIPARAGEPEQTVGRRRLFGVYPRACGGTKGWLYIALGATGLSPRVRGNRMFRHRFCSNAGSIPARAGEPRWTACGRSTGRVYPRACGGTTPVWAAA